MRVRLNWVQANYDTDGNCTVRANVAVDTGKGIVPYDVVLQDDVTKDSADRFVNDVLDDIAVIPVRDILAGSDGTTLGGSAAPFVDVDPATVPAAPSSDRIS